jgi:hypothetical protein
MRKHWRFVAVVTGLIGAAGCAGMQLQSSAPQRLVSTREFLAYGQPEGQGYGLYSYVLFATPPENAARAALYLETIKAYLRITRMLDQSAGGYVPRWQLSVTYMPVRFQPPFDVSGAPPGQPAQEANLDPAAGWILQNYDYERAQYLLQAIAASPVGGPYIVSYRTPLTSAVRPVTADFVFQDMSRVEPHIVPTWMNEFLRLSVEPRFWERESLEGWSVRLRTTLAQAAAVWPHFVNALEQFVQYRNLTAQASARK